MKVDNKLYTINDVAKEVDISVSTVRKYEQDYDLKVMRNESNNRVYTWEDIEVFKKIRLLKDEGANIHMVRKILASDGVVENIPEVLEYPGKQSHAIEKFRSELTNEIAEIIKDREKQLRNDFEILLDDKLKEQEEKIREQISAENQKLISYIESRRDEKKSIWNKIFGR